MRCVVVLREAVFGMFPFQAAPTSMFRFPKVGRVFFDRVLEFFPAVSGGNLEQELDCCRRGPQAIGSSQLWTSGFSASQSSGKAKAQGSMDYGTASSAFVARAASITAFAIIHPTSHHFVNQHSATTTEYRKSSLNFPPFLTLSSDLF
jgi:hypothetical protein